MKKKLLIALLTLLSVVCLAFALSACGGNNPVHIQHTYNWKAEVPATCSKTGTKEHYECSYCYKYFDEYRQEVSEQVLVIPISANSHSLNEGESSCCDCGAPLTEGLEYDLIGGRRYTVYKGSVNGGNITIPAIYNGKPVTSIGTRAFEDCTSLTSITIPDSVTSIDNYAFYGCTSLASITIPDSVTSIGEGAFEGCTSLASITISDSVTSIGEGAFEGCTKLIQTQDDVQYVDKWVVGYDSSISSVTLRADTKGIADYAFYGCKSLTSINIPNSVTSIGRHAFGGCTSIESITIPNSVTSIGNWAFSGCTSLTGVYITDLAAWCNINFGYNYSDFKTSANPLYCAHNLYLNDTVVTELTADMLQGVTKIKDYAFYACTSLTSINIPNSVTSIGRHAFGGCTSIESITIPNSVTSIGARAFEDCTNLTGVYITDIAAWCNIEFNGDSANPLYYAHNLYLNDTLATEITADMLQRVTEIKSAFSGCTNLTSISIPDSVTSISSGAFSGCTGLESITVDGNNSVYSSQDGILYNKEKTKLIKVPEAKISVTIPDSVTYIVGSAFSGCTAEIKWGDEPTIKEIGEDAFQDYKGTSITIPASVTSIGASAFAGCTNLASITIPNSVTSIGRYAFSYCTNLASITIGNSVTSIGEEAFRGCTSIESITIPNSVTSIGASAFADCTNLTSVKFENTTGWKVFTSSSMSPSATGVNVTDDVANNAELLTNSTLSSPRGYSELYWTRYDA